MADHDEFAHAVSDGSDPPPFQIADQERRYAMLPTCGIAAADRAFLVPLRLAAYAATLWLPSPESSTPMEVPDPVGGLVWQGWEWPSGATLLLGIDRVPLLPALHALLGAGPGAACARVAGRPMQVDRRAPDETGRDHRGWVQGFLDQRTQFTAAVTADSDAERDALLAAVLTLTPDGAPEPEERASSPQGG